MRNLLLAALLSPALFAVPAHAVDQQMFAAVAAQIPVPQPDKYDERAVLAALLARPDVAAEFEADGKAALGDPQLKALMVAKWRGRSAAYATTDVHRAGPDFSKEYHNWKEVLGPEGYAYTRQRLLSMSKDNADKLIGYLGTLDQKLQGNNFKIDDSFFAMSGKIVNGILDAYRKDLGLYLATADAQSARNSANLVAQQLAAGIQSKTALASAPVSAPASAGQTATQPAAKPNQPIPPVKTPPAKPKQPAPEAAPKAPPSAPIEAPAPAGTAKDQVEAAAGAGAASGGNFDGGFRGGQPGAGPVSAGSASGAPAPSGLGMSPSASPAPVVGAVPEPASALDDLDSRVAQAGSSREKPYSGKLRMIATAGGGLLGALVGFLLGGPLGALVGAAVGGLAAHVAAKHFL